jgi:hypothetical protein
MQRLIVTVRNLLLNTGSSATQRWLFTAAGTGVQILNDDLDTNAPGVQVVSSNAALARAGWRI